ncbi:MAG: trigger factor [Candidatus Tumulicola sp.]
MTPTQVELEIPIGSDEMAAAEHRAFGALVKNVRLAGFRQGKVPRKIFEQNYGSDAITQRAVDEVVPEVYAKALREHDLAPVARPKVEVLEESDGRPTRVKATVEVRPEIVLQNYKGMPLDRPPVIVTDADVERSLETLAKERATVVPVERPAQLGDVVTIDYEGKIDGEPFEGGSASGEVTELSDGRFIPGFVSGIVGMTAGESKEVEARFPDNYPQSELAGKDAVFAVTLHDVKRFELPPIDDAFATSVSRNANLGELRADVRRRLETIAASRERRAIANALLDALLRQHDFPLPPTMIDAEVNHLVDDAAAGAARSGSTFEQYLAAIGKSEEELRAAYRPNAEMRVKTTLLVEAIAKAENVVATPGDVAEELEALARQYGQPVAKVRKALGDGVLSLMDGIVRNKALDFLVDHAEVTTRPAAP